MKRNLKKTLCLLVALMMFLSTTSISIFAQGLITPTNAKNETNDASQTTTESNSLLNDEEINESTNLLNANLNQASEVSNAGSNLPLEISSFEVVDTTNLTKDSTINLRVIATGGTEPYAYEFFSNLNGEKQKIETKFDSSQNEIPYLLKESGIYSFSVTVTDQSGKSIEKTIDKLIVQDSISATTNKEQNTADLTNEDSLSTSIFIINDNPTIKNITTNFKSNTLFPNSEVKVTASISGGVTPYADIYFAYIYNGVETPDYSYDPKVSGTTATFTLAKAGSYTFCVRVIDGEGNVIEKTLPNYIVKPSVGVKSLTIDKKSPQDYRTKLKLTATGIGGTPKYKYKFYFSVDGQDPVALNDDFQTSNSYSFLPFSSGTHVFYVEVKDSKGNVSEMFKSGELLATNYPTIKSITPSYKSGSQHIFTMLDLKVDCSGGVAPCLFEYSYVYNGVETAIDDPTIETTKTFFPPYSGSYTFKVKVTDRDNNTSTKELANFVIADLVKVDSLKINATSPQNMGKSLKLTATGTEGVKPYLYSFFYEIKGSGDGPIPILDSIRTDASTLFQKTNTTTFTPKEPGEYIFSVEVIDANNLITATKESDVFLITDTPVINEIVPSAKSGSSFAGSEIQLVANTLGKTDLYKYTFSYVVNNKETVIDSSKVTGNTATFIPAVGGNYTFKVKLSDDNGVSIPKELKNYKVLEKVKVKSFKINLKSPQNVGTPLKLTVTGVGGKTPYTFKFYYQIDDKGILPLCDFQKSGTLPFTPNFKGNYTFYVEIKDANGVVSDQVKVDESI